MLNKLTEIIDSGEFDKIITKYDLDTSKVSKSPNILKDFLINPNKRNERRIKLSKVEFFLDRFIECYYIEHPSELCEKENHYHDHELMHITNLVTKKNERNRDVIANEHKEELCYRDDLEEITVFIHNIFRKKSIKFDSVVFSNEDLAQNFLLYSLLKKENFLYENYKEEFPIERVKALIFTKMKSFMKNQSRISKTAESLF